MQWNEKLKESRKKAKLSQLQVSIKLNICQSNISKYETGTLEPTIETLRDLCLLYRVSSDYIIGINEKDH